MVKRLLMCGAVVLCAAAISVAAQDSGSQSKSKSSKGSSFSGWITDSECGAKGANDKHADCAKKCVETKGAKYVLYDPSDQKIYQLDNQEQAAEHAAHQVHVHGTLDGDTIHVSSISMSKKSASSSKPSN